MSKPAWWEVPGGSINVDALKRDASALLRRLRERRAWCTCDMRTKGYGHAVCDDCKADAEVIALAEE